MSHGTWQAPEGGGDAAPTAFRQFHKIPGRFRSLAVVEMQVQVAGVGDEPHVQVGALIVVRPRVQRVVVRHRRPRHRQQRGGAGAGCPNGRVLPTLASCTVRKSRTKRLDKQIERRPKEEKEHSGWPFSTFTRISCTYTVILGMKTT